MTKEQLYFIDSVSMVLAEFGIIGDVSKWIACQFALESDFGNSRLAKVNCNFCGMRVPYIRLTTSRKMVGNDFAVYTSKRSCIVDYVLWLQYNHFTQDILVDLNRFVKKMDSCNYCSHDAYIVSINKLFNSL